MPHIAHVFSQVSKLGELVDEGEIYLANRAITLLGNDQFRPPLKVFSIRLVHFFPKQKAHHIGVLLDRTRFAQVAQLRPVISGTVLSSAAAVVVATFTLDVIDVLLDPRLR